MRTGEMVSMSIMSQEQWLKVGQTVILPKQAPDTVSHFRSAIVPLMGLYVGKLVYQRLVYHEMLPSVRSW